MHNRFYKQQGPSRLADLSGNRKPGHQITMTKSSKAPKRRFQPGEKFVHEGSIWELIYMYRMADKPGIWIHCLEEIAKESMLAHYIAEGFQAIGAGATTPRIVFNAFRGHQDVHDFFSDIYRRGDSIDMTTQKLLKIRKIS